MGLDCLILKDLSDGMRWGQGEAQTSSTAPKYWGCFDYVIIGKFAGSLSSDMHNQRKIIQQADNRVTTREYFQHLPKKSNITHLVTKHRHEKCLRTRQETDSHCAACFMDSFQSRAHSIKIRQGSSTREKMPRNKESIKHLNQTSGKF